MKERPILFSAPMVRSILEDRKTQTRRVMKTQYVNVAKLDPYTEEMLLRHCPYGQIGDRLWVKETWTGTWAQIGNDVHLAYAADGSEGCRGAPDSYVLPKAAARPGFWVTPLFMPRWASRITLEITDMRAQRLQDITEEDAKAEGAAEICDLCGNSPEAEAHWACETDDDPEISHRAGFRRLWDTINGQRGHGWEVNDWVWVPTFKRV